MHCGCGLRPARDVGRAANSLFQPRCPWVTQPRFQLRFLSFRYWPQWAMILLMGICTLLPRNISLWLGDRLGNSFRTRNHKRRKIAETNLRLCFPGLSEQQREVLLNRHFRLYGRAVIDLGLVWWGRRVRLDRLC